MIVDNSGGLQLALAKWACFGMMMDAELLKQCEG
jgi:hypothetical protein